MRMRWQERTEQTEKPDERTHPPTWPALFRLLRSLLPLLIRQEAMMANEAELR